MVNRNERLDRIEKEIAFYEKSLIPTEMKRHHMSKDTIESRIKELQEERIRLIVGSHEK